MGRNQGGDKRDAGGEEKKGVSHVALDGRNNPASMTTNTENQKTTSSLRWHECLFGMQKKKRLHLRECTDYHARVPDRCYM